MKAVPRVIAHRCGGALAPENTLAGLQVATRLGCKGVEFDAMLSGDGVPILIHDETFERTTGTPGRVAEMPWSEAGLLDAGRNHHRAFSGEPVPSLAKALESCRRLGLWANVEIKPSSGLERETGKVVAEAVAGNPNVVLSSFSLTALEEAARTAPGVARAMLVDALAPDWKTLIEQVRAVRLHVAAHLVLAERIEPLLAAGIPVAAYTVNRRADADRLFALGVSSVFTDRPDLWMPEEM